MIEINPTRKEKVALITKSKKYKQNLDLLDLNKSATSLILKKFDDIVEKLPQSRKSRSGRKLKNDWRKAWPLTSKNHQDLYFWKVDRKSVHESLKPRLILKK